MGKYKYAIKMELNWLKKELQILDDIENGISYNFHEYSKEEISIRKKVAKWEMSRIQCWLENASRKKKENEKT